MVSRRKVLQGIMAMASSPALPRLPMPEIAAAAEVVESAIPARVILTPLQRFLNHTVEEYLGNKIQFGTHLKALMDYHARGKLGVDAAPSRYAKTWIDGVLPGFFMRNGVDSATRLIYLLKCSDWKNNLALSDCHTKKDEFKTIFANNDSIHAAIYDHVNTMLSIRHPLGAPDENSITKDNVRVRVGREGDLTIHAPKDGNYSRGDIHFLIESQFMKTWGFRPWFFHLSEEQTDILHTVEQHPLFRHALSKVHSRWDYFWEYYARTEDINPFNNGYKPWDRIPADEKESLKKMQEDLSALWPERRGGRYGHLFFDEKREFDELNFKFSDIEETVHDMDAFMVRAKKSARMEARNKMRRMGTRLLDGVTFEPYPVEPPSEDQEERTSSIDFEGSAGIWLVHHHGYEDTLYVGLRERFSTAVAIKTIDHQLFIIPGFDATEKDFKLLDSKPYEKMPYETRSLREQWEMEYKYFIEPPTEFVDVTDLPSRLSTYFDLE